MVDSVINSFIHKQKTSRMGHGAAEFGVGGGRAWSRRGPSLESEGPSLEAEGQSLEVAGAEFGSRRGRAWESEGRGHYKPWLLYQKHANFSQNGTIRCNLF